MDIIPPIAVTVAGVGSRNQFDGALGPASGLSCLRTSLSFLHMTYAHGINATLSSDMIDGCLQEGAAWTTDLSNMGRGVPDMCALVDLPNRISYIKLGDTTSTCCVLSRIYGDSHFFTVPDEGFMCTQIPARAFFDDVWMGREESYTIITVDSTGMAIYRQGNISFIFDPHGHGTIGQAVVVRVNTTDVYSYIASEYTHRPDNVESQWAAALVFFVTANDGPVSEEALSSAVTLIYGSCDTYFTDEQYCEKLVTAQHPLLLSPPNSTTIVLNKSSIVPLHQNVGESVSLEATLHSTLTNTVALDPRCSYSEVDPWHAVLETTSTGSGVLDCRRRRRPSWTPPSSEENLACIDDGLVNNTHSTDNLHKPAKKVLKFKPTVDVPDKTQVAHVLPRLREVANTPDVVLNVSNVDTPESSPTFSRNMNVGSSLKDRKPFLFEQSGDVNMVVEKLLQHGHEISNGYVQNAVGTLDTVITGHTNVPIWVTRPLVMPDEKDPLELFINLTILRLTGFVVENGTRTHHGATSVVSDFIGPLGEILTGFPSAAELIRVTSLILTNMPGAEYAIKTVLRKKCTIGMLIIAKFGLVAMRVQDTTGALHAELDVLEADLGGSSPIDLYSRLSTGLISILNSPSISHPGLFAELIPTRTGSLSERIRLLCELVSARETRYMREHTALVSSVKALENALRSTRNKIDAIQIPEVPQEPPEETDIPPEELIRRVYEIRSEVTMLLTSAVTEYFTRGVLYSTRALIAEQSPRRFRVATASTAPIQRLLDSLPEFDAKLTAIISSLSIHPPPETIQNLPVVSLLKELIKEGEDLNTDTALVSWLSVVGEAQTAGYLSRREFDELSRTIKTINTRATQRASAEAELSCFNTLSAAVDQAVKDYETYNNGEVKYPEITRDDLLATIVRATDDLVRQIKILSDPMIQSGLQPSIKRRLETRLKEVQTYANEARTTQDTIKSRKQAAYNKLGGLLRPVTGFVGLRAAVDLLPELASELDVQGALVNLRTKVLEAPVEIRSQLTGDFWALFNQYRDILEHPGNARTSVLGGLGACFTAIIEIVPIPTEYRPSLLAFFGDVADVLASDIATVSTNPESESAINAVVATLSKATLVSSTVPALSFVLSLYKKYQALQQEITNTHKLTELQKQLGDDFSTLAVSSGHLKFISSSNVDDYEINDAILSIQTNVHALMDTVKLVEVELQKLPPHCIAGTSTLSRVVKDLHKLVTMAHEKKEQAKVLITDCERAHKQQTTRVLYERWTRDIIACLEAMETRHIFNGTELARLRDMAAAGGFDIHAVYPQARQVVAACETTAVTALDTVFRHNPHTPENTNIPPPLALLRGLTWFDDFSITAPVFTVMFPGVSIEGLLLLMRIRAVVLLSADTSINGIPNYRDMILRTSGDLLQIPALAGYVDFYTRSYDQFITESVTLSELRADIRQAAGAKLTEANKALEEVTHVRAHETAKLALKEGVFITLPSEGLLIRAIEYFTTFDHKRFIGTAYERVLQTMVDRDLKEANAELAQFRMVCQATKNRAIQILQNIVDTANATEQQEDVDFTNLKTLLKLTPPPKTIALAIDRSTSVQDIVTQFALLLGRLEEETGTLDIQAVDWMYQARNIIDSHPLSVRIDGTGPLHTYKDRVDKLYALRTKLDLLRRRIETGEVTWDDAWTTFKRETGDMLASGDTYATSVDSIKALQASASVVDMLCSEPEFFLLPVETKNRLQKKQQERKTALDVVLQKQRQFEETASRLRALIERIPTESDHDVLRMLLRDFDQFTHLPIWIKTQYMTFRNLLMVRLGLYASYAEIFPPASPNGVFAPIPAMSGVCLEDQSRCIRARVAAFMGEASVVQTFREARSSIDALFGKNLTFYLDTDGVPLRYRVCYKSVGVKLGTMLCSQGGLSLRPALPDEGIVEETTLSALRVANEVNELRIEYESAIKSGFSAFSTFVRHRHAEWGKTNARRAIAEIYAGLITTTLTRQYGVHWDKLIYSFEKHHLTSVMGNGLTKPIQRRGDVRVLELTLSDIVTILVATTPVHLLNFARLDLIKQHEYMARTLRPVIEAAFRGRLLVRSLDGDPKGNARAFFNAAPSKHKLPLALGSNQDPTGGRIFAFRMADWKLVKMPQKITDPFAPWQLSPPPGVKANVDAVTRIMATDRLTTITVLGRMCLPPISLVSMWNTLQPEEFAYKTQDDVDIIVDARLDLSSTLNARFDTAPSNTTLEWNTDRKVITDAYIQTGATTVFTVTGAAPTHVSNVTAFDIATTAILFGAPLVIAMELTSVFSQNSGLTLGLKLFDSRHMATDSGISSAVSPDIVSWGLRLLHMDPHPIENACLIVQLEKLSALIANKPLTNNPPCLLLLDEHMNPSYVLWERKDSIPAPDYVVFWGPESLIDLPYIDSDEDSFPSCPDDPFYSQIIAGYAPQGPPNLDTTDFYPTEPLFKSPVQVVRSSKCKKMPAQPAQPVQPVQPAQTVQPAQPIEPGTQIVVQNFKKPQSVKTTLSQKDIPLYVETESETAVLIPKQLTTSIKTTVCKSITPPNNQLSDWKNNPQQNQTLNQAFSKPILEITSIPTDDSISYRTWIEKSNQTQKRHQNDPRMYNSKTVFHPVNNQLPSWVDTAADAPQTDLLTNYKTRQPSPNFPRDVHTWGVSSNPFNSPNRDLYQSDFSEPSDGYSSESENSIVLSLDEHRSCRVPRHVRVVNADVVTGRRYVRGTALGALALLSQACRRMIDNVRYTRKLLMDHTEDIFQGLGYVKLLLDGTYI
uniref:ORF22 n=1 Tax=Human herpesvirus 3 TaxID=10335 RepID=A0A4D6FCA5_HHV3|nr:ORF22 [Human alphaherpesvirus 3]